MTADPTPFSHLGICVSDLDRSLRFYCDGLGFEMAEGFDLDDSGLPGLAEAMEIASPVRFRSQMITKGDLKLELLCYEQPEAGGSPSSSRADLGFTHLTFAVDDVDATAATLVNHGGTLLPGTRASVGAEIVFLADPDGCRIELMAF